MYVGTLRYLREGTGLGRWYGCCRTELPDHPRGGPFQGRRAGGHRASPTAARLSSYARRVCSSGG
ncbi:hypothetical protein GCM10009848_54830 [Micromonospora lupini]